jgi:CRP-like cAMP-binding protein
LHGICVGKVPLFSALEGADMAHVASLIRHNSHRKGDILFSERDKLGEMVIVNAGSVKAYTLTPDGREQILYIFGEGDFFGERNLFGDRAAPYTAEALSDVKTCTFSRESFRALLHAHPEIAIKIIEALEDRLARLENVLKQIGVRSVDARIGALLIEMMEKYGEDAPEGVLIRLPLSREGIANYLGIARETLSRKLSQLEGEGVIRAVGNKTLVVRDRDALLLAADAGG